MCLELYAAKSEIEIPFEDEQIYFLGPDKLLGTYTILLKNVGSIPLNSLCWLYPRPIFGALNGNQIDMDGVEDVTELLPHTFPYPAGVDGQNLRFDVPDPNRPDQNIPGLRGKWTDNGSLHHLTSPVDSNDTAIYSARHIEIMQRHGFAAVMVTLNEPLESGESQWFSWKIETDRVGVHVPQSVIGPHVFHQFASPVYVHRLVSETCLTAIEDFDAFDDFHVLHIPVYESLVDAFALNKDRQVDVQRHFLTVCPGDPTQLALMHWQVQGDLRMLSGSPDVVENANRPGEPVFKWKSGSAIGERQNSAQITDDEEGFMLRLMLRY